MQVNGDINFTGTLTLQGRDIKQYLDNHYELGLVLVRGLIGGGYVGASIYSTLTTIQMATDSWGTSVNSLTQGVKYGGWASAHSNGYVFLNQQDNRTGNNKIAFANETVTTIGARTYNGSSPSTIQHGVGYETTGTAFGTKAYTCGTESTGYDKLSFSTDTFTSATDSSIPTGASSVGWFDKEYGYHFASPTNRTAIYPFANETWSTLSTTSSPSGLGMPGGTLEKGLNTKKGKFYLAGNASWINNTIFQFRNSIATWTVNNSNQTAPNCETAGVMGQIHGYMAGGYQSNLGQNAHSDKVKYDTDTIINIADAPRSLSSGSPLWSPI